jgi:hypothetical protein
VALEIHADHFAKGTPDSEWIPFVATRGWVLLTLDAKLRYNKLERDAIMGSGLAAFVLVGGRRHDEKAAVFLEARSRVERFLRRNEPPFIAKIYRDGSVKRWLPK